MPLNRKLLVVIVTLTALRGAVVLAQLSAADRSAIERYRTALRAAEAASSPGGLEAAFAAFGAMQAALMRTPDGGTATVVESLSDEEFDRLQRDVPSALISREEVVFVRPDPDYFARLAAVRGDEADRAFFSAMQATYPDAVWPSYVTRQTDDSGCTRFGSMSLVETYRAWSAFQRRYPERYGEAAARETNAVLDALTRSTCACGAMAAVEQELDSFIRLFPDSSAQPLVKERLDAVRGGRPDIRARCVSG